MSFQIYQWVLLSGRGVNRFHAIYAKLCVLCLKSLAYYGSDYFLSSSWVFCGGLLASLFYNKVLIFSFTILCKSIVSFLAILAKCGSCSILSSSNFNWFSSSKLCQFIVCNIFSRSCLFILLYYQVSYYHRGIGAYFLYYQ